MILADDDAAAAAATRSTGDVFRSVPKGPRSGEGGGAMGGANNTPRP